jgi:hypothetical protein
MESLRRSISLFLSTAFLSRSDKRGFSDADKLSSLRALSCTEKASTACFVERGAEKCGVPV